MNFLFRIKNLKTSLFVLLILTFSWGVCFAFNPVPPAAIFLAKAALTTQGLNAPTLSDPGDIDTDGKYYLNWTDESASGAVWYELQEGTSPSFDKLLSYTPLNNQQYIHGKKDGTYYYRVRAWNIDGVSSDFSNVVDITVSLTTPAGNFLTIKDSYFYDPTEGDHWLPHGIAYQTWNRPLGVWQTHEQIEYDLAEMEKTHVNSIRVDFVWKHIEETGDNQFTWANYDYLLEAAARHNIKVFALIGYQWPPDWFPGTPGEEGGDPGWYTMHPPGFDWEGVYHSQRWTSDIISFEDSEARAQYTEFLTAVANRYKDNPTIAAWIVGNEYGYLGLWSSKQDGYDPDCENAFRDWLADFYSTIEALNSVWGTTYISFSEVVMPAPYDRDNPAWWDLVQWREESAAGFLAIGAKAVKDTDINHLISYSTVGMQWGEEDWRYHAEDLEKIAKACENIGAPLDFWSINNYPWGLLGHESQTGQWGIVNAKWKTKLPVLYTETGFTSSETMYPGMNEERQSILLRNSLWEALETGAIGVHVFHWHDRQYITDREKGFGIVYPDRRLKPAYWMVRNIYNLMEQIDFVHLLVNSEDPEPDVAFLWTDAVDSMYNRYECNMQQIYGPLERLGLEPTFINYRQLLAGEYQKYKAIILPRNIRTHPGLLNFIRTYVIPAGVNVYADADLPGMQDYHVQQLGDFVSEVEQIFGIDVTDTSGYETPLANEQYGIQFEPLNITVQQNLSPLTTGRIDTFRVWKYSDATQSVSGNTIATYPNGNPALQIKNHSSAKAAITTFSLGDVSPDGDGDGQPDPIPWARHYDWFKAIFLTSFGINPVINLTGSQYVLADYRICQGNCVLISFKNYRNDTTETVILTTDLIIGKTVQSLTEGDVIEENSDGTITISLEPDGHKLLFAYSGSPQPKTIITDARATVHPVGDDSYPVKVWYDTRGATLDLEVCFQEDGDNGDGIPNEVYSQTSISVTGSGEQTIYIFIPDANQADSDYISTPQGGNYKFSAYLKDGENILSSAFHSTRLEWGVKIAATPTSLEKGQTCSLTINWEDLYEYLSWEVTPLSREVAFPGRALVYKSTKTEAQFPGHYEKFNQVCAWLESLGYTQAELGVWESTKGYYILTDTDLGDDGQPLNLNWGYLKEFYSVLILPGVYVMNDAECNNVAQYLQSGLFTVIATDGGVGIKKEDGSSGIGRIENVFGVNSDYTNLSNIGELIIAESDHYITHDYQEGAVLITDPLTEATAWTNASNGQAVATVSDGSNIAPAIICNSYGEGKAFTFNFGIDTFGQLTTNFNLLAQRVFEWATREAYKIKVQLKYPTSNPYDEDIIIAEEIIWVLEGTGTVTISFKIPRNSMTGDNLIWVAYIYPWDAEDPWAEHKGFYTSENDPGYENTTLAGFGLQITGITSTAYAGRMWDLWTAYNTRGETFTLNYGLTDNSYEEKVYIYYDANYPVSATTHSAALALANGLVSKFNQEDIDTDIIDAITWQEIVQENRKVWVINVMGIAPDTVWDGINNSLIEQWLDSGGKILWMGEWEFYYIGHSGDVTETKGETGSQLVFDFQPTGTYDNRTMSPTDLGNAFIPGITTFISDRGASIDALQSNTQTYEVYAKSTDDIADPCLFNVDKGYFVKFHMSSYAESDVSTLSQQIGDYIINRGPDYGEKIFWQATQVVNGEEEAVRFDPWAPDFDPDILEYISSLDGGKYEWSVWFSDQPNRYNWSVNLYWAPRLKVEEANFPTLVSPGETVSVPLEWENLPEIPAPLKIIFQDPYTGVIYVDETFTLNTSSDEDSFSVTIPPSTPYGANYLWSVYTYPSGNPEPYSSRYGLDDTFRFDISGAPVEPETQITVSSGITLNFSAPSVFEKSVRRNFDLNFDWDGLETGKTYKLFYILIEADTGDYSAASWDHNIGGLWQGDEYVIDNTGGSQTSGSYAVTKDLTPYAYDNFIWVAEIRDENDNTLVKETIEATTIKGAISGQVFLEGRSDYSETITFQLRNPGETTPLQTYEVVTDSTGNYILGNIEPGSYDLAAKSPNCLRQVQMGIDVYAGGETANINFNLLGGDGNDDNSVGTGDMLILKSAWLSNQGDENWDERADFNGDGSIGTGDMIIMKNNWLVSGEE